MGVKNMKSEQNKRIFNSPLEMGLRALFILSEISPDACDITRLCIYDYLLTHSSDVEDGPESLHPPIPHRSTELLIKKEIMQKGLLIMQSKELVKPIFSDQGIYYESTHLTVPFLSYIESIYAKRLQENAKWVVNRFSNYDDNLLNNYINSNLEIWGGEFFRESLLRNNAL